MSSLTFRPRAIDITKRMPIIRKELENDTGSGVHRSVPQMPAGMDPEDEEEQHIQEAIARSLEPSVQNASEIPTPSCKIVPDYADDPGDFVLPSSYIRYKRKITKKKNLFYFLFKFLI
eukprot:TRINITY_DN10037_c0_g1_i1.p1 TRINITY_DN10037_c0_g1~~TRINITY_DN10037_c0_g1_i1.p1  ORF type:complete len:118 (+),score=16.20 TRINITY_DN10037_c0_g1_i1:120-473(+)